MCHEITITNNGGLPQYHTCGYNDMANHCFYFGNGHTDQKDLSNPTWSAEVFNAFLYIHNLYKRLYKYNKKEAKNRLKHLKSNSWCRISLNNIILHYRFISIYLTHITSGEVCSR